MKRINCNIFFFLIFILLLSPPVHCLAGISLFRVDKDIAGRVIDADTGMPIKDVVVSAVWGKEVYTIAGTNSEYHDAYETLTDEKGEFFIPGKGTIILSRITSPSLRIFKAAYEDFQLRNLGEKHITDGYYKERFRQEDDVIIISLKEMTMEERKKKNIPSPPYDAPLEKVILLLKEIDKDEVEQGLKPRRIWRGKEYD